jgi:YbbR domain-containing protein
MNDMRWFAKNIRTFLLALVLGVSVWMSAVRSADPDEVRTYPRPIPLEIIGQDPSLVRINEVPTTVDVSMRAPGSVWELLTTQDNAVRASLDLSGLSAGEHTVPVKIMVALRPYEIVLTNPTTVTVDLESLTTQTFPLSHSLSLSGQPAAGYQAGDPDAELTEVAVSGPESLVRQATRARILINLDGLRESIDDAIPVQILDAQNQVLNGLTINPESVQVMIPIIQQGGYRDVAVKVIVQNPELVNQLPGVVETQPLDLQDRKENISTRLSLDLPEDITIIGAQTVQVQVSISPIQTSLTLLNQPINVNGLSEGLGAQTFPQTVDVIISGPVPVLEELSSREITVSVDATGLEAGTYQLAPEVKVSVENVLVESILPGTVEVVIGVPLTPTPTLSP